MLRLPDAGSAHRRQHGVGKLRGAGRAAHVAGERLALGVDRFQSALHLVGGGRLVQVAQHQDRRLQQRRGVGHVLAGDVRRRAVHRLEDGALQAEVGARHQAQPADQGPRTDR